MKDWQPARLFTTVGVENGVMARQRATEALLSVMPLVPGFASALLRAVGVRLDAASKLETFVGVRLGPGRAPVVDGVIRVSKGRSQWQAALLVRTGQDRLTPAAVKSARAAAAKAGFDAVITLTNDAEGPALGGSRSPVAMHHWPWGSLVNAAVNEKVRDPEQAYVLGELVAFLGRPDAGVVSFADMGPNWAGVLETARLSKLSARNAGVRDVGGRWDQVISHAALALGQTTGRDVQQVLPAVQSRSDEKRLAAVVEALVRSGQLDAVLRIADAPGELALVADLTGRRLVSIVVVTPPAGLGARATVGWLLDSLENAPPDAVVESWAAGGRQPLAAATVGDLVRGTMGLEGPRGKLGHSYRVLLADEMGIARSSGSKAAGFVESVEAHLLRTWTEILEPLHGTGGTGRARPSAGADRRSQQAPRTPNRSKATRSKAPSRRSKSSGTTRSAGSGRSGGKSAAELARELRKRK